MRHHDGMWTRSRSSPRSSPPPTTLLRRRRTRRPLPRRAPSPPPPPPLEGQLGDQGRPSRRPVIFRQLSPVTVTPVTVIPVPVIPRYVLPHRYPVTVIARYRYRCYRYLPLSIPAGFQPYSLLTALIRYVILWPAARLAAWRSLVGLVAGWLAAWLAACLTGLLAGWLRDPLPGWPPSRLSVSPPLA
eukprot:gene2897-biopygen10402